MNLTILCDNNTVTDRYFLGEPGLSFFIEADGTRILFDCGYSDIFLQNAQKANINLLNLDYIVLSHGHLDHTWGLQHLIRLYTEAKIEDRPHQRPTLVAHPDVFATRAIRGMDEIGALLSREKVAPHFPLKLSAKPVRLSKRLVFLGQIERSLAFEQSGSLGELYKDDAWREDDIPDDSALAYLSDTGLVVITGCAHAGVCNTVEQARRICDTVRVRSIIGGTHLLQAPTKRLEQTSSYLDALRLESFFPCHCTDLAAKIALAPRTPLQEVGSGSQLAF